MDESDNLMVLGPSEKIRKHSSNSMQATYINLSQTGYSIACLVLSNNKRSIVHKTSQKPKMKEQRPGYSTTNSVLQFFTISCVLLLLSFSGSVTAYKNYTVGDSLGWYDTLEKPDVNYQKWADTKNFSLGDFLIFNTDNNHSIIQTYNFTTYKLCDYDDALQNDTTEWSAADPSATAPHPVSVAIPLVKEGMNYFFSSDYDGEQCNNGQHFKINVSHGQGLPKSLEEPSDDAPAPNSPDFGSDDSAPDTIVPSNFNHPIEEEYKDEASGSVSLDSKFNGFLILLEIVCIFLKF